MGKSTLAFSDCPSEKSHWGETQRGSFSPAALFCLEFQADFLIPGMFNGMTWETWA